LRILVFLALLASSLYPADASPCAGTSDYIHNVPAEITVMTKTDSDRLAQASRSPKLPLPRDAEVAVREELELARTKGTIEAMQNFVARHDGHPLAEEAKRELTAMKARAR
jgi:hypothetical protein